MKVGGKWQLVKWSEVDDPALDLEMYGKYSGELFGVLV